MKVVRDRVKVVRNQCEMVVREIEVSEGGERQCMKWW